MDLLPEIDGPYLRALRNITGFSLAEVSRRSGVCYQTISNMEYENYKPRYSAVRSVWNVYQEAIKKQKKVFKWDLEKK